jgi:hypothetical protein
LFDPYSTRVVVPYGKPAANQLVESGSFSVERADLQVKVKRYDDDVWYQHAKRIEQVKLILESWFQDPANYVLETRISRIQGWKTIDLPLSQRENNIGTSNVSRKFPVYTRGNYRPPTAMLALYHFICEHYTDFRCHVAG